MGKARYTEDQLKKAAELLAKDTILTMIAKKEMIPAANLEASLREATTHVFEAMQEAAETWVVTQNLEGAEEARCLAFVLYVAEAVRNRFDWLNEDPKGH